MVTVQYMIVEVVVCIHSVVMSHSPCGHMELCNCKKDLKNLYMGQIFSFEFEFYLLRYLYACFHKHLA